MFHLQTTVVKANMRTHYGSHDILGSLAYNICLLGRKHTGLDAKLPHNAKELLISSFYAMVRRIWLAIMRKTDSTSELSDTLCPADINAALLISDMFVYLELFTTIKHGDTKRLQAILKLLTVMMSAGGSPPYTLELLQMDYGVRYAWTKVKAEAIFSSMLMSTKGQEDSFIPLDLCQVFNNKLVMAPLTCCFLGV
ncbi:hypothetical protein BGX24_007429 [Mortierella sp. AD032]|nr:hypothetical protein BGX24_007429 [Mortierella sp. AD032]